ncbi:MAG: hypothetical protein WCJ09_06990 [Planctomycetota bacterium]
MEPNGKDLAEFARLGLRFHILPLSSVTTWADGIIAETNFPAPWLIDLAMADDMESIENALRHVPGEAQADLAIRLFLALVCRQWRSGNLSIGYVREIGWSLHCESALPSLDGQADWGVCLEVECEELDAGWRTEDDLRASIEQKLAQYSDLEGKLPAWA